ncbi:hypothetical protein [Bradyrhizobium sp. SZCCHNRI1009]|uniref:hypothetical protein n=1 Tax=Bradyrhizobium sp. SZCCHNRI1009 TaxID=3057277 RepID=UPI00291636F5|nr:hypothetical protein [Bradyrhizobium sp. SZCCHNRI1009]
MKSTLISNEGINFTRAKMRWRTLKIEESTAANTQRTTKTQGRTFPKLLGVAHHLS